MAEPETLPLIAPPAPPPPAYTIVTDLAWLDAGKTRFSAMVVFPSVGPTPIPFTARADDPEAHGREIFERATAGDFGPIKAFKAPTAAEIAAQQHARALRIVVSDVQFAAACATAGIITEAEAIAWAANGTLPASLETAIAALPAEQQFSARIKAAGATSYERASPIVAALGAALGKSAADLDALFVLAESL